VSYKRRVKRVDLLEQLINLCNSYYDLSISKVSVASLLVSDTEETSINDDELYQCRHCMTVYDKTYGDEFNSVPAGTSFSNIEVYTCPVCEAQKDSFELIEKRLTLRHE